MSTPQIMTWRGVRIEELSRDELIAALQYAAGELAFYQKPGMSRALALGKVEMFKRGERTS